VILPHTPPEKHVIERRHASLNFKVVVTEHSGSNGKMTVLHGRRIGEERNLKLGGNEGYWLFIRCWKIYAGLGKVLVGTCLCSVLGIVDPGRPRF
jgi:hypothetical protein